MANTVRVTRVRSRLQRPPVKGNQIIPTGEVTDISALNRNTSSPDPCNDNMKTPSTEGLKNDADLSRPVQSATKKHSTGSRNEISTVLVSPMVEQRRDTIHSSLTMLNNPSCKVTSSNKYNPTQSGNSSNLEDSSTKEQMQDDSKLSLFCISDREQLSTIGKESKTEERRHKRYVSRPLCWLFKSVFLLLLPLVIIAVILIILFAHKSTTTIPTNAALRTTLISSTSSTSASSLTSTIQSTTSSSSISWSSTTSSITDSMTTITTNLCVSILTGMQSVSHCGPCPILVPYYHFTYNYTAISNVTRIAFACLIQDFYFAADNISVRDFVAPNTELITNGGFETGDLTGWEYCNQLNASSTGGVKSNYTYAGFTYYPQSGAYYYLGGSNISADYIIQSFPTQIGHQYTVSTWSMYPGSGSQTSADLFLGV